MTIRDVFAACYIVNLKERADRRREMEQELSRLGLVAGDGWVEFFPATRPDSAGPFPSVGARGCFLSHLAILRLAHELKLKNVLVMEDDLTFEPNFALDPVKGAGLLLAREWDMAYLGHVLPGEPDAGSPMREHRGPVQTTHFYAVNGRCLPRLIAFLETVLSRPPGHPDGGPMHIDGAFSTFREQNADVVTLVATPALGRQRSSRSDVTPGWADRFPLLRSLTSTARAIRRRFGR